MCPATHVQYFCDFGKGHKNASLFPEFSVFIATELANEQTIFHCVEKAAPTKRIAY